MKTQTNARKTVRLHRYLPTFVLFTLLALAGVAQAQSAPHNGAPTAAKSENQAGTVNINTATETELTRLPGIGPARAKAIIELRGRLGGHFKQTEDLMRVRGIGRKSFRKLAPMVTLQGPTTLATSPAVRSK